MRLEKFRVTKFRNIHDSGWIDLAGTTALVGRNESGKTNLLLALDSLFAKGSEPAFSRLRDFPADRPRKEYTDHLGVIHTRWSLDAEERGSLAALLPGTETREFIEIERAYTGEAIVRLGDSEGSAVAGDAPKELASQLETALWEAASRDRVFGDELQNVVAMAVRPRDASPSWGDDLSHALEALDAAAALGEIDASAREVLSSLAELAHPTDGGDSQAAAERYILDRIPRLLYVDEVPEVAGRMDLREFAKRRRDHAPDEGDREFGLLLELADIDEVELGEILDGDPEVRRRAIGEAGAIVTRKIRRFWNDRPIKVRFYLDVDHLHTLVCDPGSFADVEVNLNQRSRGFRWFFSFFVTLTAAHNRTDGKGVLLLLDEPGLHLHAASQQDLIAYLGEFESQVILATQSTALLPTGDESAVLSVQYDVETGAQITAYSPDLPAADSVVQPEAAQAHIEGGPPLPGKTESMAPAAPEAPPAATAMEAAEPALLSLEETTDRVVSGLVGEGPALLVENLSDFWYLCAASDHLVREGGLGLPEGIVPVPVGGAAHLGLLARLARLGSDAPIVVIGSTPRAEMEARLGDFAKSTISGYIFLGDALGEEVTSRVEIEDLIEPAIYRRFVRTAYVKQLEDREPTLDPAVENIAVRYKRALAELGIKFLRTDPARFIGRGSERNTRALLSGSAGSRFEKLFEQIRSAFESGAEEESLGVGEEVNIGDRFEDA